LGGGEQLLERSVMDDITVSTTDVKPSYRHDIARLFFG